MVHWAIGWSLRFGGQGTHLVAQDAGHLARPIQSAQTVWEIDRIYALSYLKPKDSPCCSKSVITKQRQSSNFPVIIGHALYTDTTMLQWYIRISINGFNFNIHVCLPDGTPTVWMFGKWPRLNSLCDLGGHALSSALQEFSHQVLDLEDEIRAAMGSSSSAASSSWSCFSRKEKNKHTISDPQAWLLVLFECRSKVFGFLPACAKKEVNHLNLVFLFLSKHIRQGTLWFWKEATMLLFPHGAEILLSHLLEWVLATLSSHLGDCFRLWCWLRDFGLKTLFLFWHLFPGIQQWQPKECTCGILMNFTLNSISEIGEMNKRQWVISNKIWVAPTWGFSRFQCHQGPQHFRGWGGGVEEKERCHEGNATWTKCEDKLFLGGLNHLIGGWNQYSQIMSKSSQIGTIKNVWALQLVTIAHCWSSARSHITEQT